ncbi:MAG TPA: hypothetical protein VFP20_05610 [Bacteroidales bacterium]|nr:hypothetical protein [Bacteroidales bacterium]
MKKEATTVRKLPEATKKKSLVRDHLVTIALNDPEFKTLEKYCAQYKISNRSRFIRESLMKSMLARMVDDYPTLFGEKEMR